MNKNTKARRKANPTTWAPKVRKQPYGKVAAQVADRGLNKDGAQ